MPRRRTRARQLALQFLYLHDQRGAEVLPELREFIEADTDDPEVALTARDFVEGAIEGREGIDRRIEAVAENWEISRMAIIDRNILRLATYEILERDDIPLKVSINEAIELGKVYSTRHSGAFINGILDQIVQRMNETDGCCSKDPSRS